MFYLLLLTPNLLCLTDNTFLPLEFCSNIKSVLTFNTLDDAELYIHRTLTTDDFWDMGLLEPHTYIQLGKVYHRH